LTFNVKYLNFDHLTFDKETLLLTFNVQLQTFGFEARSARGVITIIKLNSIEAIQIRLPNGVQSKKMQKTINKFLDCSAISPQKPITLFSWTIFLDYLLLN